MEKQNPLEYLTLSCPYLCCPSPWVSLDGPPPISLAITNHVQPATRARRTGIVLTERSEYFQQHGIYATMVYTCSYLIFTFLKQNYEDCYMSLCL